MGQNRPMFRHTAHVYDLVYQGTGKDYRSEAAVLHGLIQERAPGAASLLDVACGTGGHLLHLRQWYDVAGVDVDPGMLDAARQRLPEVTFVEGDMRDFHLDRTFDAVCCLFSSIGYMGSAQELDRAVATMVSHCGPGGVFVMDGWVRPGAWQDEARIHLDTASDETVTVARMSRSRRLGDKTILDMHHLIGSLGGIEHEVDVHQLTLFEAAQYEESMRRAGLIAIESIESPMPDRDRYVAVVPT
jgi:SAM-dependent methyltransferase